jgi:hypothetical protein
MRRTRWALVCLLVVAVGVLTSCSDDSSGDHAPRLAAPDDTGRELATEFLTILQDADLDALDAFLADGFQLQRTDGTGATKDEYLQDPAQVNEFTIGPAVVAVQQDDVLTVRWTVTVDSVINGQQAGRTEAPRLSTYVWVDGRWRLLSHANFNALS